MTTVRGVQAAVAQTAMPPSDELPLGNAWDVKSLMEAFQVFQEHASALSDSYSRLQTTVEQLNQELESKNRALEASLAEQQRLHHSLRSIVDSLHDGVIAVDLSGAVTLFNRRAAELTHKQESEVLGKPYTDVFPEHAPILLETLRSARPQVREFSDYLGHLNEHPRQIEVTTALVRDGSGELLGAVEVLHDMTERREMEAQLRRRSTLEALGEVAVTIAHEIRNPLGAIQLFAETLRDGNLSPEEREEKFDDIFSGIKLMNNTISNLLQFTRPVAVTPTYRNIAPLLDRALSLCEHAVRQESVTVERDYPPISLMCHADESQLLKALLNLLLNAVQAMAGCPERMLRVRARRQESGAESALNPFDGTPWVEIEIRDTGCGIPQHMLERIFTPFVTTKEQGVGLGLPIVHKIVEAHEGKILVESTVGVGATLRLLLPVYRPED